MDDLTEFNITSRRSSKRVSFARVTYVKEFINGDKEDRWGDTYEKDVISSSTSSLEITEALESRITICESEVNSTKETNENTQDSYDVTATNSPPAEMVSKEFLSNLKGFLGLPSKDQTDYEGGDEMSEILKIENAASKDITSDSFMKDVSCDLESLVCNSSKLGESINANLPDKLQTCSNSESERFWSIPMNISEIADQNMSIDKQIRNRASSIEEDLSLTIVANDTAKLKDKTCHLMCDIEETKCHYSSTKPLNLNLNKTLTNVSSPNSPYHMEMTNVIIQNDKFRSENNKLNNSTIGHTFSSDEEMDLIHHVIKPNNLITNSIPNTTVENKISDMGILRDRTNLTPLNMEVGDNISQKLPVKAVPGKKKGNRVDFVQDNNIDEKTCIIPQGIELTLTGADFVHDNIIDEKTRFMPHNTDITQSQKEQTCKGSINNVGINFKNRGNINEMNTNLTTEKVYVEDNISRKKRFDTNGSAISTSSHQDHYAEHINIDEQIVNTASSIEEDINLTIVETDSTKLKDETCQLMCDIEETKCHYSSTKPLNLNLNKTLTDVSSPNSPYHMEMTNVIIQNDEFRSENYKLNNSTIGHTFSSDEEMDLIHHVIKPNNLITNSIPNTTVENKISDMGILRDRTNLTPLNMEMGDNLSQKLPVKTIPGMKKCIKDNRVDLVQENIIDEKTCVIPQGIELTLTRADFVHDNIIDEKTGFMPHNTDITQSQKEQTCKGSINNVGINFTNRGNINEMNTNLTTEKVHVGDNISRKERFDTNGSAISTSIHQDQSADHIRLDEGSFISTTTIQQHKINSSQINDNERIIAASKYLQSDYDINQEIEAGSIQNVFNQCDDNYSVSSNVLEEKCEIVKSQSIMSDISILSLDSTIPLDFESTNMALSLIANKTDNSERLNESHMELSSNRVLPQIPTEPKACITPYEINASSLQLDKHVNECVFCREMDLRKIDVNGTSYSIDKNEEASKLKLTNELFCLDLELDSTYFHLTVKTAAYTTKDLKVPSVILAMKTFAASLNNETLQLVGVNLCDLQQQLTGISHLYDDIMNFLRELYLVRSCYPTKIVENRVEVSMYFSAVKTKIQLEFSVSQPMEKHPHKATISGLAKVAFGIMRKEILNEAIEECNPESNFMWAVIKVVKVIMDRTIK